jgi:hypothetical protein
VSNKVPGQSEKWDDVIRQLTSVWTPESAARVLAAIAQLDLQGSSSEGDVITRVGDKFVPHPASGGGSTPDLAAVLAGGNDTGGVEIVNVTGVNGDDAVAALHATSALPQSEAHALLIATGTGDAAAHANVAATAEEGDALATTTATGTGNGDVLATTTATAVAGTADATSTATAADGDADVSATAGSTDGEAKADRGAVSGTWRAQANTNVSAGGSFGAKALTDVQGINDASAATHLRAHVSGAGTASAEVRAMKNDDDLTGAGFRVEATNADGYKMGFGEKAETPVAIPEVAASPTTQGIVDALKALGLITQAA